MIAHFSDRSNEWRPTGFDAFREFYPLTDWSVVEPVQDLSEHFRTAWQRHSRLPENVAVVLTPGIFSEWLPRCFARVRNAFIKDGHRCLRTPVLTQREVPAQARYLDMAITRWLEPDEPFVWCTHSKGSIDALWALEGSPVLRERCVALAMVQVPASYSWVVEDIQHSGTLSDRITWTVLNTRWMRNGIDVVSRQRDETLHRWLHSCIPEVPVLHAVSWSTKATSWADSWHRRLTRLRPGHAHDGQFYLQDQRLRALPVVCLPELDHAQPVVGGNGLDSYRFWSALAHTAYGQPQAR